MLFYINENPIFLSVQEEKLQKEALKAKAAQLKKQDKEIKKLQNGKYALKYITAEIDLKLLENGAIGGVLYLSSHVI